MNSRGDIPSWIIKDAERLWAKVWDAQHGNVDGDPVKVIAEELWTQRVRGAIEELEDWRSIDCAPTDGTLLHLLIDVGSGDEDGFTPFDDSTEPYETIGFNNLSNTGEDRWQFAGWDWQQDCIVNGVGKVIGWLPFLRNSNEISSAKPIGWISRIDAQMIPDSIKGCHTAIMRHRSETACIPVFIGCGEK